MRALAAILLLAAGSLPGAAGELTTRTESDGIWVLEDGAPVLFFHGAPMPGAAPAERGTYLHPILTPSGTALTLNAPEDHPHHRGLFWAWHQVVKDGVKVADGWDMKDIDWVVDRLDATVTGDAVRLSVELRWMLKNGTALIREEDHFTIHATHDGVRRMDAEVRLKALLPGVAIGGSDNERGYGGPSWRLPDASLLSFESGQGAVKAEMNAVTASGWMQFHHPHWTALMTCAVDGVPVTRWILRNELSMQNCAWPGRQTVPVPGDRDIVLESRFLWQDGAPDAAWGSARQAAISGD